MGYLVGAIVAGFRKGSVLHYPSSTDPFLQFGWVINESNGDINLRGAQCHPLIEDLMLRDVSRYFGDSERNFWDQYQTSETRSNHNVSSMNCASSRYSNSSTSFVFDERDASHTEDQSLVNSGLMLPIFCFEFAWRSALASWRCFCNYMRRTQAKVASIASRVLTTLHGSSDDIGWLQCAPGMAPVEDGSARFKELLQDIREAQKRQTEKTPEMTGSVVVEICVKIVCIAGVAPEDVRRGQACNLAVDRLRKKERQRNGMHKLPDCFVYLLIPGLFSNHGPLYFVSAKRFFSRMGLACHIAKIHSEASVEHNAWELKQYIEELYWGSGKQVMLLGHSKGGVDAAAALSIYSPELRNKVAGLALVQSPYGGTPIASDILREGQLADKETRRIMEFLVCKLIKGDIRALEDLTYERRKEFIKNHKLPENIPLISFHSEASVAPGVLATMSHIAHAELPWLPQLTNEDAEDAGLAARKVPVIVPVSAAMALCALHLELRYGEKSDGLVTCRDAEVPGSIVVKPDRKLDHSWMVYSSWKKESSEPDACEMCEALLTMLVELGTKVKN
ncbi:hypothetical protein BUALT_Bualt09G0023700 [Buddleja alternifolia]|uniref:Alpha/beta-Hydrolases superfamily protein n=1 Tax=Buddleja alternifolia TaxID=168488 RepID=A0AAV6X7H2_9LAMI|nr:hypothetical protein BUALT_Bualt09G0023700 [Buddleja alternifolia]